jgi:hypothetical protein
VVTVAVQLGLDGLLAVVAAILLTVANLAAARRVGAFVLLLSLDIRHRTLPLGDYAPDRCSISPTTAPVSGSRVAEVFA